MPWEALYLASEDLFVGIDAKSNVVRILDPGQSGSLPDAIKPPIRMLVAVANPCGDLEAGAEVADIERRLANLLDENKERYEVQTLLEATRDQFGSRVEDWKPHIIHFIGHGGFDDDKGLIYFHDSRVKSKRDPVDSASLRDLVRNDRPWLVVLNSCLSAPRPVPILSEAPRRTLSASTSRSWSRCNRLSPTRRRCASRSVSMRH